WTPERILMRVDLPAPLSPRRQVTSPARTNIDTSDRATTLPKYFETLRTSSNLSVAEAVLVVICSSPLCPLADVVVEDHRQDQDHADEDLEPVAVDSGHDDPLLDHGEGERADGGADH